MGLARRRVSQEKASLHSDLQAGSFSYDDNNLSYKRGGKNKKRGGGTQSQRVMPDNKVGRRDKNIVYSHLSFRTGNPQHLFLVRNIGRYYCD